MKSQTILAISNEKIVRVILNVMFGDDFTLIFAKNIQQGIDLAVEHPINLILLDLQITENSGFELFSSLNDHPAMQGVPLVVMTGNNDGSIQTRILTYGATDCITKSYLFANTDDVKMRLHKHLLGQAKQFETSRQYKDDFRSIIKKVQAEAEYGDFYAVCKIVAEGVMDTFAINHISLWNIQWEKPSLVFSAGVDQTIKTGLDEMMLELAFRELAQSKRPSLSNNLQTQKNGDSGYSHKDLKLYAEIRVPLFKIDKDTFIKNRMVIPGITQVFGCVILKRSTLFTTKEYKILSRFLIQCGTVLWELYRRQYSNKI